MKKKMYMRPTTRAVRLRGYTCLLPASQEEPEEKTEDEAGFGDPKGSGSFW